MLDPAFEAQIRGRLTASPFGTWFGVDRVEFGDGTCAMWLPLKEHHLNPGGIAHGGVLATLLDMAIGLALRTTLGPRGAHVTTNLSINYLRAAMPGEICARGTSVHAGGRLSFGEGTLSDAAGRVLARGTASFLNVPPEMLPGKPYDGD